jgi:hypothetical protein
MWSRRRCRLIVETVVGNNLGGGNLPWKNNRLVGLGSYTRGKDVRPAAGAHIAAHQESTFGVIFEPEATGSYCWKGLRVYCNGTSTVIPTSLGILGSNNPKAKCKALAGPTS